MKVYLLLWICAACDGAAGRRQTYQKVRAHHEHERHLEATTAAPTKAPTKVPLPTWYYEWEGAVIPTGGECTRSNQGNTQWQCESPGYCGNCTNIPQISTAGFWAKETIDDLDDPLHGSQRNFWTKPVVVRESSTTCYCLDAATWKAEKDYCPSGKFAHVYAGSTCEDSCLEFPCCKNKWNRVIDCPESCTDTIFNVQKQAKERAEDGCYKEEDRVCKVDGAKTVRMSDKDKDCKATRYIYMNLQMKFAQIMEDGGEDSASCISETDVDCGGANDCPRCKDGQVCLTDRDCVSGHCRHKLSDADEADLDVYYDSKCEIYSGSAGLVPSFLTLACLLLASLAV